MANVMPQQAPVMRDVARRAGVSHQTVSRVLNDQPNVSKAARQRVEAAIFELGYHRNTFARNLRTRKPRTIGVLLPRLSDYGPRQILSGIERAARQSGYFVTLASLPDNTIESIELELEHFAEQPVAGTILVAPDHAVISALNDIKHVHPLVVAGFMSHGERISTDDHHQAGARMAVSHLIEQGHTKIGHLSGPAESNTGAARIAGWQEAMRTAGLEADDLIPGDWTARCGYEAGLKLAGASAITAVFAGNDQMALGLLRGVQESGMTVPLEMSIVGYDNQPESANFLPPLTSIGQDFETLGERCVQELLREGPEMLRTTRAPAPSLVIRATSQPAIRAKVTSEV